MQHDSVNDALASVLHERHRQDAKWGEQDHDPFTFITILGEEFGEFCEAALHTRFGGPKAAGLRVEAVQIAAVALAIVECLDRGKWSWEKGGQKTRKLSWGTNGGGEWFGSLEGQPGITLFLIHPTDAERLPGRYFLKGAFVDDRSERFVTYATAEEAQEKAAAYMEQWFTRNF